MNSMPGAERASLPAGAAPALPSCGPAGAGPRPRDALDSLQGLDAAPADPSLCARFEQALQAATPGCDDAAASACGRRCGQGVGPAGAQALRLAQGQAAAATEEAAQRMPAGVSAPRSFPRGRRSALDERAAGIDRTQQHFEQAMAQAAWALPIALPPASPASATPAAERRQAPAALPATATGDVVTAGMAPATSPMLEVHASAEPDAAPSTAPRAAFEGPARADLPSTNAPATQPTQRGLPERMARVDALLTRAEHRPAAAGQRRQAAVDDDAPAAAPVAEDPSAGEDTDASPRADAAPVGRGVPEARAPHATRAAPRLHAREHRTPDDADARAQPRRAVESERAAPMPRESAQALPVAPSPLVADPSAVPASAPSTSPDLRTQDRLVDTIEQLAAGRGPDGNPQVRMVLNNDVLPGVSVAVQQAAAQVQVVFTCSASASRAQLDRIAPAFAKALARRLGRDVVVQVHGDDGIDELPPVAQAGSAAGGAL